MPLAITGETNQLLLIVADHTATAAVLREFINAVIEGELDIALSRPRYARHAKSPSGEVEEAVSATGHRYDHRSLSPPRSHPLCSWPAIEWEAKAGACRRVCRTLSRDRDRIPLLKIDWTGIALVGASLIVASGDLPLEDA